MADENTPITQGNVDGAWAAFITLSCLIEEARPGLDDEEQEAAQGVLEDLAERLSDFFCVPTGTGADLCPFARGTKKPPRLKYPDGLGKAGYDEGVAKHKAEVAVQIFAHRLWLWKQDKPRADVDAVLAVVKALRRLADFPGGTRAKQKARRVPFEEEVKRITGNADF